MTTDRTLILGCGILQAEVACICQQQGWDVDFHFLNSSLHCNLDKLGASLENALMTHQKRNILVFYGTCHPLMDQILKTSGAIQTRGQNCVEMLLGRDLFMSELRNGAFFLLEDWTRHWEQILAETYSNCPLDVIREMFTLDRKYFLAIKTPCSPDFQEAAEHIAAQMQVPLRWLSVSLDRLTAVLADALWRRERP